MTEIIQHQLDELSVTDILSYLGARVSSVEEDIRRNRKQLTKAKDILNGLYFIIQSRIDYENNTGIADEMWRAKQFLNSEVGK